MSGHPDPWMRSRPGRQKKVSMSKCVFSFPFIYHPSLGVFPSWSRQVGTGQSHYNQSGYLGDERMITARYNAGAVCYPIDREDETEALFAQSTRRNIPDNLSHRIRLYADIRCICLF
jgi:hypothetical protein